MLAQSSPVLTLIIRVVLATCFSPIIALLIGEVLIGLWHRWDLLIYFILGLPAILSAYLIFIVLPLCVTSAIFLRFRVRWPLFTYNCLIVAFLGVYVFSRLLSPPVSPPNIGDLVPMTIAIFWVIAAFRNKALERNAAQNEGDNSIDHTSQP